MTCCRPETMSMHEDTNKFQVITLYTWQWLTAFVFLLTYLLIIFGMDVPGCGYVNHQFMVTHICCLLLILCCFFCKKKNSHASLADYCNAAGYMDEEVLTPDHM